MRKAYSGLFDRSEKSSGKSGGVLRPTEAPFRRRGDEVRVSADLCRRLRLRGGELIAGEQRRGKNGGPELARVTSINGRPISEHLDVARFEDLTAVRPEQPMSVETAGGPLSTRLIDLFTPIGFGQRGLIVAPPRTGKTVLLQEIARGVAENHPQVFVLLLLIDERPEEVTDMRRNVPGEVVASSNDLDSEHHVRLARLMIERAKRMVEGGRDVLVLLDSLTRLGRAFNQETRSSGRVLSGGLDVRALSEPKSVFGSARNLEEAGSLTIIATALVGTGSRMDDVIFSEFKGTGNLEITLSQEHADRRIWPSIDITKSGTRHEELLLSPAARRAAVHLRRAVEDARAPQQATEALFETLRRTRDNAQLIASVA